MLILALRQAAAARSRYTLADYKSRHLSCSESAGLARVPGVQFQCQPDSECRAAWAGLPGSSSSKLGVTVRV